MSAGVRGRGSGAKLSDQLGDPGNRKLQRDIMARRGSREDSRKGIITCVNGDCRGLEAAHRPPALGYWEKEEVL